MSNDHMAPNVPEVSPQHGPPDGIMPNGHAPAEVAGAVPASPSVVPLSAKKEGLTLERLRQATVRGDAAPLKTGTATAVTVEVTKPEKGVPFRVHPDLAFTMEGYSLTTKVPGVIGDTIRLLDPSIAEMIPTFVRHQLFCLCYDGWQRKPFIWPINIQVEGARANAWTTSAHRVLHAAREDWVCLVPGNSAYLLGKPILPVQGEPVWPGMPFDELMLLAFKDLYIGPDNRDHPEIAKRLIAIIPE
jgi:hypothetical protein